MEDMTTPQSEEQSPPSTPEEEAAEEPEQEKTEEKSEDAPAPVSWEDLKLPEGADTSDPIAAKFLEVANTEYESPAERAQALVDLQQEYTARVQADMEKAWLDTNAEWQDTLIKQHGEKPLDAKLGKVAQMIDRYDQEMRDSLPVSEREDAKFGAELRDAMTLTGAGNNPAAVNFLIWIAEQSSEGAPLSGTPTGQQRSRAEILYDGN